MSMYVYLHVTKHSHSMNSDSRLWFNVTFFPLNRCENKNKISLKIEVKYCCIFLFLIEVLGLNKSRKLWLISYASLFISPFLFSLTASSPKTELRCSSPGVQTIRPIVTGPVSWSELWNLKNPVHFSFFWAFNVIQPVLNSISCNCKWEVFLSYC